VQVQTCDIHDDTALVDALRGSDAVINLAGILHETSRNTFDTVHHQLPKRLVKICDDLSIGRFLHMSALGSSEAAPSAYLRSKALGEVALSQFKGSVDITTFKPSVIFGRGDRFLNLFASLIKWLPVLFLAKPDAKFQPIWVEDVATIFVNSLNNADTYANSYPLVGPKVYTLRELVEKTADLLNKKRLVIGLSDSMSYLQAWLEVASVSDTPMATEIAFSLMPLEAVMPSYILNKTPRAAYDQFRTAAGRIINARR